MKNIFTSRALQFLLGALIIGLLFAIAFPLKAQAPASGFPLVTWDDRLPPDAGLERYLTTLAFKYECTAKCAQDLAVMGAFRHMDSNNRYSYGCLQFQEATWMAINKQYGLDPWVGGGIYSCNRQLDVAKRMFQDDPVRASKHWYTSIYTRGLGLPPD